MGRLTDAYIDEVVRLPGPHEVSEFSDLRLPRNGTRESFKLPTTRPGINIY